MLDNDFMIFMGSGIIIVKINSFITEIVKGYGHKFMLKKIKNT